MLKKAKTLLELEQENLKNMDDTRKIDPHQLARNWKIYQRNLDEEAIKIIFKRMSTIEDPDNLDIVVMNLVEQVVRYQDPFWCLYQRKQVIYLLQFIKRICRGIISNNFYQSFSLSVIILNSITIALQTDKKKTGVVFLDAIDPYFLKIVSTEMVVKMTANGIILAQGTYLRDKWNVLDFFVVMTSWINIYWPKLLGVSLQALRILKPLKMISKQKKLKVIMFALFNAAPQLYNTIFVIIFCFWIFAIAGLQMFQGMLLQRCFNIETGIAKPGMVLCGSRTCMEATNDPKQVCGKMLKNPNYDVYSFDNIWQSFMMVFLTVTLENWSMIMEYIKDVYSIYASIFFILLVMIGGFFLVNLTLAVITIHFINQSKVTKRLQRKLLSKKTAEEEQQCFRISTFKKLKYKRYYEPYQKLLMHKFKNYDQFRTKPWDKRKGGFKRGQEMLPPNTELAEFRIESSDGYNSKSNESFTDTSDNDYTKSKSSSDNSSLDRQFTQIIWEMKRPSVKRRGWKIVQNTNIFSLANINKKKFLLRRASIMGSQESIKEKNEQQSTGDEANGDVQTRQRSNTNVLNRRRKQQVRRNLADIEIIPESEEGEDADDEYFNPIRKKFTIQQQSKVNWDLSVNKQQRQLVTPQQNELGSPLPIQRAKTQIVKLKKKTIVPTTNQSRRNLFKNIGRQSSLIIRDEMFLAKPQSPATINSFESFKHFNSIDVDDIDEQGVLHESQRFIPIKPIESLNFMGMAKRNICFGKRTIRKVSFNVDKNFGRQADKKEVLNFIREDFCNPEVEPKPADQNLSINNEEVDVTEESFYSFKQNDNKSSNMEFSDDLNESQNLVQKKIWKGIRIPAMQILPNQSDLMQTSSELKMRYQERRKQHQVNTIENQIQEKFAQQAQEEIWQRKHMPRINENQARKKVLQKLPKEIYQDTRRAFEIEKEKELIKSMDVTFFKVRVKKFHKYFSSSFNDVLKTRQQDVQKVQKRLLNSVMQKARIKINYMNRYEMDNEFYELRHQSFLKSNQNININCSDFLKSRQILTMDKFKKITEYDNMPKIPIKNSVVALQIQEYRNQQEHIWKYGEVKKPKTSKNNEKMLEQSPKTKMRIFRRLKKKVRTISKIEYNAISNSMYQKLEHDEEHYLDMKHSENQFGDEYKLIRVRDMVVNM